jgi:hypothetical protein
MFSAACQQGGPDGTPGELGKGGFVYRCDSDSDAACDDGAETHPMPGAVALGSRFSVTFSPRAGEGSALVEPASKDFLTTTQSFGSSFKALKPGTVALLARRGDRIVDLIHIQIAPVEHIQVDTGPVVRPSSLDVTSLTLSPGDTAELRAIPAGNAGEALAGSLSSTWSVADESVASISSLATDNHIVIHGKSAGATTALIEMAEVKAEVRITVTGGAGGDGGAGGAGGSGGAGGGQ